MPLVVYLKALYCDVFTADKGQNLHPSFYHQLGAIGLYCQVFCTGEVQSGDIRLGGNEQVSLHLQAVAVGAVDGLTLYHCSLRI